MKYSVSCDDLAAAEVCLAVASRILYCEPSATEVANQVASRQFASSPFGDGNSIARHGLGLMDRWCSWVLEEALDAPSAVATGASTGAGSPASAVVCAGGDGAEGAAAARLLASPLFCEQVDALRREWLRLFVGLGTPEASCLESFYVEPSSHLFGKSTLAVREAYRRHGLQVEKLHAEPDDHLGLMLGFMSHLVGEELSALEAADEERAAGIAREQESFLCEHVLPWLAPWRYGVETHAGTDYFLGLGDFIFGLVACYAERFSIAFDEKRQMFARTK